MTLLIDPDKKATFERLCAEADVTPSQMVRKLIRDFIEQQLGLNTMARNDGLVDSFPRSTDVGKPAESPRDQEASDTQSGSAAGE